MDDTNLPTQAYYEDPNTGELKKTKVTKQAWEKMQEAFTENADNKLKFKYIDEVTEP